MVSFSGYHTFALGIGGEGPPRGYETSPRYAAVQERLAPLITAALREKGYTLTSGHPDFFVLFGSGRRRVADHQTSDDVGGNGWLPVDENADLVEGAVVIDAFDGATTQQIWHGASQTRIDPDHLDDARLQKSVADLIAAFPPAAGSHP